MEKARAKNIRVLIADDHPMMLTGIRAVLATQSHVEIVGEALDGREVMAKTKALKPDIVVMDISMPYINGLDAARQLRDDLPQTKIIILSMYSDREYITEFLKTGASGYVLKNNSPDEILKAITIVYDGDAYFSPSISRIILEECQRLKPVLPDDLTEREVEVLVDIVHGLSTKEIADKINRSAGTVSKHRENIMKKTNCHSTARLIQYAHIHNLIKISKK